MEATLGAGPGLTNGYGTPRYRILAALSYVPGARPVQQAPAPIVTPAPPPPPPAAVIVEQGKIRVLEKVNFATNKDNVLAESLHILDDVFQIP